MPFGGLNANAKVAKFTIATKGKTTLLQLLICRFSRANQPHTQPFKKGRHKFYRLYVNSWGNPKNEIEIFNKWQKIKLSLVFGIDRQTYAKYDCGNA